MKVLGFYSKMMAVIVPASKVNDKRKSFKKRIKLEGKWNKIRQ